MDVPRSGSQPGQWGMRHNMQVMQHIPGCFSLSLGFLFLIQHHCVFYCSSVNPSITWTLCLLLLQEGKQMAGPGCSSTISSSNQFLVHGRNTLLRDCAGSVLRLSMHSAQLPQLQQVVLMFCMAKVMRERQQ